MCLTIPVLLYRFKDLGFLCHYKNLGVQTTFKKQRVKKKQHLLSLTGNARWKRFLATPSIKSNVPVSMRLLEPFPSVLFSVLLTEGVSVGPALHLM
jgi:hypothetical protein